MGETLAVLMAYNNQIKHTNRFRFRIRNCNVDISITVKIGAAYSPRTPSIGAIQCGSGQMTCAVIQKRPYPSRSVSSRYIIVAIKIQI